MKIAQVAPLYESVPPIFYGGTERVVSYLTEELIKEGHEVTLFASGDSVTAARLVVGCEQALRLDPYCRDPLAAHFTMLGHVADLASQFDIVHFHIDYLHFPLSQQHWMPHLTTLHGRLDLPELGPLYRQYRGQPLVSISNAQRIPLAFAHWVGTVYHGLPLGLHTYKADVGTYLAFMGRIAPEKLPDHAIEIACRSGIPLRMAAKVDKADQEYFRQNIMPRLQAAGRQVEFVGELGGAAKNAFLSNAFALLFPVDWPEPFGLVMIEALACGTPVIAYRRGSVPEILDDGITGFIVDNLKQALDAVQRIPKLHRSVCRQVFEERFSAMRMARDYLSIYDNLLGQNDGDAPQRDRFAGLPIEAKE